VILLHVFMLQIIYTTVKHIFIYISGFQKIGVEVAFINFHQRRKPLFHSITTSGAKAVFLNTGKQYMLQIIYTTVFRVKRLNSESRGINITCSLVDLYCLPVFRNTALAPLALSLLYILSVTECEGTVYSKRYVRDNLCLILHNCHFSRNTALAPLVVILWNKGFLLWWKLIKATSTPIF
jgi:hypothetical protein